MGNAGARAGLSIGGALIGSYFGPIGAAVGGMLGGVVGSLLFPPDDVKTTSEGPKLADLSVQTSTYGNAVPLLYGTVRVAGNVIWSTGLIEHINVLVTEQNTGKGGNPPTSTVTTYTYTVSLAVSLANNVIVGIKRVWADDKLWYDFGDPPVGVSFAYELYKGTETQLPCPAIEADKGVGNVPGFRGQAYIVFKDLQLEKFGNRVPNFHFEVVAVGTEAIVPANYIDNSEFGKGFFTRVEIDTETGLVWYSRAQANKVVVITPSLVVVKVIQDEITKPYMLSYQPPYMYIKQPPMGPAGIGQVPQLKEMEPRMWVSGDIWGLLGIGNAMAGAIDTRDYQMRLNNDITEDGSWFQPWGGIVEVDMRSIDVNDIGQEGRQYVYFGGANVNNTLFRWTISDNPPFGTYDAPGPPAPVYGWFFTQDLITGGEYMYHMAADGRVSALDEYGQIVKTARPINDFANRFDRLAWDKVARKLYATIYEYATGNSFLYKFSEDLATVHWNIYRVILDGAFVAMDIHPQTGALYVITQLSGNTWMLHEIDKIDGSYVSSYPVENTANKIWMDMKIYPNSMFAMVSYVAGGGTLGDGILRVPLTPGPTGTEPTLKSVVEDLSLRTGLTLSDIDAAPLAADFVSGYVVASRMPARQAIEPLMQGFFFDAVESDHIAKFVKRGGASVKTISYLDSGAHEPGQDPTARRDKMRQEENEMPWQVDIQYLDKASFYKVNVQYARRLLGLSKAVLGASLPVVYTATQAKRIAEVLLYNTWVERQSVAVKVTRKYLDIDPTDLVTFQDSDNSLTLYRVKKIDYTAPNLLEMDLVEDDVSVYSQFAVGIPGEFPTQVIDILPNTLLYFLDTSIMGRQADDNIGFYFAAGPGYGVTWPGAGLYRSDDGGASYNVVTQVPSIATAGYGEVTLSYEGSIP